MLELLNDVERRALDAYVSLLVARLGDRLLAIRVFGSVARGESWPRGMPIRSDLDLLLYLESGRQISPRFRTETAHAASPSRDAVDADAVEVWPCR
ncbi:MAG TPA: nucleotidyltransferase domain-containing protein [Gaiellaceae bacterium]|jgi:predicted nucleotidyltransferase|nr:nucleotidyltransferase domain-containing protein [Gaiellaceae bacterium]